MTIGGIIKFIKGSAMKKREYKILLENWNAFLKEENKKITSGEKFIEKFILNGISKVRKEILSRYAPHIRPHAEKTLKLMIRIEKLSSNDYFLRAYFVFRSKEEINSIYDSGKVYAYGRDENENIEDRNLADIAHVEFQKINKYSSTMSYNLHSDNTDGFKTTNSKEGFTITYTDYVKSGLGPLIYDIILEFVSSKNCVLCADRTEVSGDAQRVWDSYLIRSDVKNIQLDNVDVSIDKKSTPEFIKDDITQISAANDSGKNNWKESSLSKGFYKESYPIINYFLNNENFIIDIPGFKN